MEWKIKIEVKFIVPHLEQDGAIIVMKEFSSGVANYMELERLLKSTKNKGLFHCTIKVVVRIIGSRNNLTERE